MKLDNLIKNTLEQAQFNTCNQTHNNIAYDIKEFLPFLGKLKYFTSQWYSLPTAVGSCMLIKREIINK